MCVIFPVDGETMQKWFLRTRRVRGCGVSIKVPKITRPGEGRLENCDIAEGIDPVDEN